MLLSLGCVVTLVALLPQGFASGNPDTDAYCVRKMVSLGVRPLVCQSFAKNMGLYGERVGCFSIVCADADEAERVTSQVKQRVLRALWSFPPVCPLPNGLYFRTSPRHSVQTECMSVHVETVSALSASDRETQCTDSLIRLTSVSVCGQTARRWLRGFSPSRS